MIEKLDNLLETLKSYSSQERLDLVEDFSEFRKGYLEEQCIIND
jgi:hypothetical protein